MPAERALPQIKAPPLSCDCHLHVFGDALTYPYSAERRNTPPAQPLAEYLAGYRDFASRCGIERMVFTQLNKIKRLRYETVGAGIFLARA